MKSQRCPNPPYTNPAFAGGLWFPAHPLPASHRQAVYRGFWRPTRFRRLESSVLGGSTELEYTQRLQRAMGTLDETG